MCFCASVCSSLWEHELGLPEQVNNPKLDRTIMPEIILEWLKENFRHVDSIIVFRR